MVENKSNTPEYNIVIEASMLHFQETYYDTELVLVLYMWLVELLPYLERDKGGLLKFFQTVIPFL